MRRLARWLLLLDGILLSSAPAAQCGAPDATIVDGGIGPGFGTSVALAGDVAVLGSTQFLGDHFGPGMVGIRRRAAGVWVSEGAVGGSQFCSDELGRSVDTDGTWIIAGQPNGGGCGTTYFFNEVGGVWGETQFVTKPGFYGSAVALDGTWAASSDPGTGVDLFERVGSDWILRDFLPATGPGWGGDIDLAGDVLVVGSYLENGSQGEAVVYRRSGTQWLLEQTLTAGDGQLGDRFGWSVAVDDDLVAVGATKAAATATEEGAAYLFRFDGSSWVEELRVGADVGSGIQFGWSIAVAQDLLVIGQPGTAFQSGQAVTYRRVAGTWVADRTLLHPGGSALDQLGWDVTTDGAWTLVGALEGGSGDNGAVHVYPATPLALLADTKTPPAGSTVTFETCGGSPAGPALLALLEFDGVFAPTPLVWGAFDPGGGWSLGVPVPPGLSGFRASVAVLGLDPSGAASWSNPIGVAIQ